MGRVVYKRVKLLEYAKKILESHLEGRFRKGVDTM